MGNKDLGLILQNNFSICILGLAVMADDSRMRDPGFDAKKDSNFLCNCMPDKCGRITLISSSDQIPTTICHD